MREMENREGWNIHEVLMMILAFLAGVISALFLREHFRKQKERKTGGGGE